jgi:hypothetical protein
MPSIGPLEPTSQLDAVNACLSAIGEAPIEDEVSSTRADVALITQLLSEFGYEIAPAGQVSWEGSDGDTATLNVFLPPSSMLRWSLTPCPEQDGLSMIVKAPREYSGSAPRGVFYDRLLNRDGLDEDDHEVLYIDPVFYVEWAYLPETAKQHVIMKAARKFAARSLGASEVVGFTREDEARTLLALNEDQAHEDSFNVFDSADVRRIWRGRYPGASGYTNDRNSPRPI